MFEDEEEKEGNNDHADDSVLLVRYRDFETFASELTILFDMKRLVSDNIYAGPMWMMSIYFIL